MSLYYESHITIDPVFDERRNEASNIATQFGFRLAKLIMRKREVDEEVPAQDDTFMTANGSDYADILNKTSRCVVMLANNGFVVRRYKIEDTLVDSRYSDDLKLSIPVSA